MVPEVKESGLVARSELVASLRALGIFQSSGSTVAFQGVRLLSPKNLNLQATRMNF